MIRTRRVITQNDLHSIVLLKNDLLCVEHQHEVSSIVSLQLCNIRLRNTILKGVAGADKVRIRHVLHIYFYIRSFCQSALNRHKSLIAAVILRAHIAGRVTDILAAFFCAAFHIARDNRPTADFKYTAVFTPVINAAASFFAAIAGDRTAGHSKTGIGLIYIIHDATAAGARIVADNRAASHNQNAIPISNTATGSF